MAGIDHTFDEEERRNRAFIRAGLPKMLRALLRFANVRITARSQGTYMQDAGFEAGRRRSPRPPGMPGPIRIVTGRLFRGVGIRFSSRGGTGREGFVRITVEEGIARLEKGVTVPYAAAQEFGFQGTVSVPSHQRTIRKVFGREITPKQITIRAHSRRMDIRARPYLRPALRDETPAIAREGARLFVNAFLEAA